jgi:N-acetylmuramoyl-L-alanine amidase
LNKEESAWLEEDKLKTISAWPGLNRLSGLDMTTDAEKTRLRFGGRRPVVVQIHEFTDRMEVSFYYTENFDENFNFDGTGLLVEQVVWSQPQRNTVLFKIYFKKGVQPWGHSYDFEGNDFVLDIIHRPEITPTKNKPLKGARILIDAGHSPRRTIPYDGAIGPTGYMEYEANLALAEDLKPLLEKHGATVLMTREGKNRKSLQERYKMASQEKAHLFVSLHYNALPETINPLSKPRGYSIYYNYPHSFELAKSVYESFTRLVSIPDNGLIANDVLFIPRIPQMPSILVENAYLILPEQEEMAKTREGRAPFVRAVYEGILKFYGVTPEPVLTENRKRKTRKKPARKTYLRPAKGK